MSNRFAVALLLAVVAAFGSRSVVAAEHANAGYEPEVSLKNGSSVIIFEDGQMSMRDSQGRPYSMAEGTPMEARDGRTIRMGRDAPSRKSRIERERDDIYRGA
jgi:hypothetical protein